MKPEIKQELIKFIREQTPNEQAQIFDAFGNKKRKAVLPLWYSDSTKLCYPKEYFIQAEIDEIVELLNQYIADNNLPISFKVKANQYIAGLHAEGWTISFR